MKTVKHNRRHQNRRSGLTLVELIVVVAIIVILLGVSIPGIVSLASLGRGDFGNSARNLLGALRAAKMYSATYRSITAVAYVYSNVYDSVLFLPASSPPAPANVHIIDGFALVRQPVDREDALRLAEAWMDDSQFDGGRLNTIWGVPINFNAQRQFLADYFIDRNIYFTLQNKEGQFRKFGRDAVILNAVPKTLEATTLAEVIQVAELQGLLSIRVINPWSDTFPPDGIPDFVTPHATFLGDPDFTRLPAHVFTPTGRILMPSAAAERVVLEVGPSPELSETYRFGRELSANEFSTTNADETGDPLTQTELSIGRRFLTPILIELYQSTGRVKMASEGM